LTTGDPFPPGINPFITSFLPFITKLELWDGRFVNLSVPYSHNVMKRQEQMAQKEFEEFLSEMNDLIHSGILRSEADFILWLEEVEEECQYCFNEIRVFVDDYVRQNSDSFEWFV